MFDALAVVVEGLRAIAEVHGAVKCSMGFDERGRHGERVVKIGESGIRKFLACVGDGLGGGFDSGARGCAGEFYEYSPEGIRLGT